jgi:nephrocystin-3
MPYNFKNKRSKDKKPRAIRVFVSSTFLDMEKEREMLVKRVFPRLRKICEERCVVWGEVDLRWGITDEQKAEGKVLPICLAEIKNCRPYFIGLLGERYGWVPRSIPLDLKKRQRWLNNYESKSITELEIVYGVLKNPKMGGHAYFYFREPSYLDSLNANVRTLYIEKSRDRRQKLTILKQKIVSGGFPNKKYKDPDQLEIQVYDDLKNVIDLNFPMIAIPDPLEREALEHRAFAESRHRIYIKRRGYLNAISRHVNGSLSPLVLIGESGAGKSAALAKYYLDYINNQDDDIIIHFIGSTPYSSDWTALIRRLLAELKRRFKIKKDIPTDREELKTALANWFYLIESKRKIVIILDALNQLEKRDNAQELAWLPRDVPKNIRLVVSALPGKALNALKERGWPILAIEPLGVAEKEQFIVLYLKQFTKTLAAGNINKIARAGLTQNPLFLKSLLEELRLFGDHTSLKNRLPTT